MWHRTYETSFDTTKKNGSSCCSSYGHAPFMIIAARSLLCVYLRSIGESTQLLSHNKEGEIQSVVGLS